MRVTGTNGAQASAGRKWRIELLEVVTTPDDQVAVSLQCHDVAKTGRDRPDATQCLRWNAHLTEVVGAPAVDTAISTQGHGVVRTSLDLIDQLGGHPAWQAGLTGAVKAPGDQGAVVEHTQGERGTDGDILDGEWMWRWGHRVGWCECVGW